MGGPVCLDFVNTLDDRSSGNPKDLLPTYADLARFAEDTEILPHSQLDALLAESAERKKEAERALKEAVRMRDAMFEVFWAIVQEQPAPEEALQVLNGYVQGAAQHMKLVPSKGRFEWKFDGSTNDLRALLWPIARSAADLLASDQLQFVRVCASETCKWLFLDESKNHRRRWCDMTKCGNRAKVRSFYSRQKKEL